jgi:proline iminopeptidase
MVGRHVSIGDTRLYLVERGQGYPLIVLHGGPGLDHHMFGDYLDALTDDYRLILVDQRGNGRSDTTPVETWTLKQMARDVRLLAEALALDHYAVLGHSYGAFVALQNAVDYPGAAGQTIISSGIPGSQYLEQVAANLERFEPVELRQRVTDSWAREQYARTQEDVAALMQDQWPFHFANPLDPRLADYQRRTAGGVYAPDMLRHFATQAYGGIEVEAQLGQVTQPTLVLAGRHDRTCSVEAAAAIARGIPNAELVIFEHSGHMTFVEENAAYVTTVRNFLERYRN